jgi:hypothetical protein
VWPVETSFLGMAATSTSMPSTCRSALVLSIPRSSSRRCSLSSAPAWRW